MSEKNLIGKISYDLNFDSEQNAYEFNTEVESFVHNELLGEIDDVFEQLNEKDKVIQIEFLELDLGRISYSNCKNEILERIKPILHERLQEEIARAKQTPNSANSVIKKEESETQLLIHFISKGELAWNESERDIKLNEIFKRALNTSNELIEWFKIRGEKQFIRHRFIEQFSDTNILELIKYLDKSNYEFYKAYASDLHFTQHKKPISKSNHSEFRRIVWDLILNFLFNERGNHFNQKSFVRSTLMSMAKQLGIDYSVLLNQFLMTLNQLEIHQQYSSAFPVIIRELCSDFKKPKVEIQEQDEKKQWLSQLQFAFQNKQSNFSHLFLDLAENYTADLISILHHLVVDQDDRLNLIELLGHTQLIKLIHLLQAVEGDFIIDFIESLKIKPLSNQQEIGESQFKKMKWELGLAYLFEERGSTFNRKAFVKQTILGIGNHYNLSHHDLVLSLYAKLDTKIKSNSKHDLMKEILEEMKSDWEEKREIRNEQKIEDNKILKAIEYFECLVDYTRGRTSLFRFNNSGEFKDESSILLKLSAESPELSSRFLKFIFAPDGLDLLMQNTSINFIHSLIAVCMKTYHSASDNNIQSFTETLNKHATQTNYKAAFYIRIFTDIVNSKDMNLAEILGEINQFETNLLAMDINTPIDFLSIKIHLVNLLKGNSASKLIPKNINESWKYILKVYPDKISQLLQLIALNDIYFNSFISKTSRKLQLKIVNVLGETSSTAKDVSRLLSIVIEQKSMLDAVWIACFWKTSIQLLAEMRGEKTEQISTQIFLRFWKLTKENKEKYKWLKLCAEIVQKLKNRNQNAMAKQIDLLIVKLKSELKGEKLAINEEQILKENAISYLKGNAETTYSPQILHRVILSLIKEAPNKMAALFGTHFSRSSIWIKQLPESILLRVIYLLFPKEFSTIQYLTDQIWHTCIVIAKYEFINLDAQLKHIILFDCIGKCKNHFSVKGFASLFLYETRQALPNRIRESLLFNLEKSIEKGSLYSRDRETKLWIDIIQEHKNKVQKVDLKGNGNLHDNREEANYNTEDMEDPTEKIYINNAGMVLANPYLPELFKRLQLLEDREFKDRESAEKAIHILQYMVNETCSSPEYKLLLNKLLCGIQTGVPIKQSAEISSDEKQLVNGLIQAIIKNWKAIGNTSVNGFRESFLQREGILYKEDDCWQLQVETRAYDMLLDQIPWAFSTIKFPWMKDILYVKWR